MEGSHVYLLPEGKVPNKKWCRRSKGRSGTSLGMLPGSVSYKRKPYVDDRREEGREGGSPKDRGTGRWGANEDYKGGNESKHKNEEETSPIPQGQPGRFGIESRGYARHIHKDHPTQAKCRSQEEACLETMGLCSKMKPGSHGRGQQIASSVVHLRGLLPGLASQHCLGKEGKWKIEDMRRLHEPKQGLHKGQLSLPRLNRLMDSTTGYKLLIFKNAFSRYNQIKMAEEDQEKTTFITSQGLYCYKVMPFRVEKCKSYLPEVGKQNVQ